MNRRADEVIEARPRIGATEHADTDREDWRAVARSYKDQRDVLQSELDAARALLDHRTADLDAVVTERDVALERVAELEAGPS